MGAFKSKLAPQLKAAEDNAARFVRASLLDGGKRWKRRMIQERMMGEPIYKGRWVTRGGEPRVVGVSPSRVRAILARGGKFTPNPDPSRPLAKVTGRGIRSLRYNLARAGATLITLNTYAGGSTAPYMTIQEDAGRLQYERVAAQELARAEQAIATGLKFLSTSPGAAGALSATSQSIVAEPSAAASGARGAAFAELGWHHQIKRSRAKYLRQRAQGAKRFGKVSVKVRVYGDKP